MNVVPGESSCPVCDSRMRPAVAHWCFACHRCGVLQSTLRSQIGDATASRLFDEQRRETALVSLRKKNFERILDRIASLSSPSSRDVLEVGCAHGWFLDAAARRGYQADGIEPDAPIAAAALRRGHRVAIGYFPEALAPSRSYDCIVFNDVFEHLPDPRAAMEACAQRLRPQGLLVLNLPSSRGIFFRVAALLARAGFGRPHERLWQKGFPSPHISYFHPDALTQLAARAGLHEVYRGRLDSLDQRGLWPRLRLDRRASLPGAALTWLVVKAASPLLGCLPADIVLQIYRSGQR